MARSRSSLLNLLPSLLNYLPGLLNLFAQPRSSSVELLLVIGPESYSTLIVQVLGPMRMDV